MVKRRPLEPVIGVRFPCSSARFGPSNTGKIEGVNENQNEVLTGGVKKS